MSNIINLSVNQDVSMSDDWYELTDENHFWIKWRFKLLQRLIKPLVDQNSKIFEIGCGNGLVMYQFEKFQNLIIDGCDLNAFALGGMFDVSGKVFLLDIYQLHPDLLGQYDAIILLDVVEHIDDDLEFLKTACKYLRKDGFVFFGVPAHQSLFSKFDKIVGHKRRYSKREVNNLFKEAGIETIQSHYWGFSLVVLVLLRKFYLQFFDDKLVINKGFKPPGRFSNWIMIQVMKFETYFFPKTIIGTSIMAIGRKC
jgi:SAM-dependent methyltransferase